MKSHHQQIRNKLRRRRAFEKHREIRVVQRTVLTKEELGIKYGFMDSGLEKRIAKQIEDRYGIVAYEPIKVRFTQPAKNRTYKPDFLLPNGIFIEVKGRFTLQDRQKHEWVRKQCPDLDIRFVFSNPQAKLRKGAKSTYAQW